MQADWHVADLAEAEVGDPFEATPPLPVEQVGTPIDLTTDVPTLQRELERLLKRESGMFRAGVTCDLKDREDTCCSACPLAGENEDIALLCSTGQQQERVATMLAAARRGE